MCDSISPHSTVACEFEINHDADMNHAGYMQQAEDVTGVVSRQIFREYLTIFLPANFIPGSGTCM